MQRLSIHFLSLSCIFINAITLIKSYNEHEFGSGQHKHDKLPENTRIFEIIVGDDYDMSGFLNEYNDIDFDLFLDQQLRGIPGMGGILYESFEFEEDRDTTSISSSIVESTTTSSTTVTERATTKLPTTTRVSSTSTPPATTKAKPTGPTILQQEMKNHPKNTKSSGYTEWTLAKTKDRNTCVWYKNINNLSTWAEANYRCKQLRPDARLAEAHDIKEVRSIHRFKHRSARWLGALNKEGYGTINQTWFESGYMIGLGLFPRHEKFIEHNGQCALVLKKGKRTFIRDWKCSMYAKVMCEVRTPAKRVPYEDDHNQTKFSMNLQNMNRGDSQFPSSSAQVVLKLSDSKGQKYYYTRSGKRKMKKRKSCILPETPSSPICKKGFHLENGHCLKDRPMIDEAIKHDLDKDASFLKVSNNSTNSTCLYYKSIMLTDLPNARRQQTCQHLVHKNSRLAEFWTQSELDEFYKYMNQDYNNRRKTQPSSFDPETTIIGAGPFTSNLPGLNYWHSGMPITHDLFYSKDPHKCDDFGQPGHPFDMGNGDRGKPKWERYCPWVAPDGRTFEVTKPITDWVTERNKIRTGCHYCLGGLRQEYGYRETRGYHRMACEVRCT